MEGIKTEIEDFDNKIEKIDTVADYTVAMMTDGTLNTWGKNDRGQMGISPGIGIDMIESESVPTMIDLKNSKGEPKMAKDFAVGQYTMLIQDEDNELYQTGLRLNYEPKHLKFDDHVLNVDDIKMIACG